MGIFDMEPAIIITIGVLAWVISLLISLLILYFIIKIAVKNGTIEAQGILQNRPQNRPVQVKVNPRELVERESVEKGNWICPKCTVENPNTAYVCENCKYSLL